jgi:predicted nucleic acid-binding protein
MRVVLDTNAVSSTLLFSGTTSRIADLWQAQRIKPLLSKPFLEEYLRVLASPQFRLSAEEIRRLREEELLRFAWCLLPQGPAAGPEGSA